MPRQINFSYNKVPYGTAKILEIKPFLLANLNEFIARLDTGYSREECEGIIRKMYPKVDFEKTRLSLILCLYLR